MTCPTCLYGVTLDSCVFMVVFFRKNYPDMSLWLKCSLHRGPVKVFRGFVFHQSSRQNAIVAWSMSCWLHFHREGFCMRTPCVDEWQVSFWWNLPFTNLQAHLRLNLLLFPSGLERLRCSRKWSLAPKVLIGGNPRWIFFPISFFCCFPSCTVQWEEGMKLIWLLDYVSNPLRCLGKALTRVPRSNRFELIERMGESDMSRKFVFFSSVAIACFFSSFSLMRFG